jgi:hypothetical protein
VSGQEGSRLSRTSKDVSVKIFRPSVFQVTPAPNAALDTTIRKLRATASASDGCADGRNQWRGEGGSRPARCVPSPLSAVTRVFDAIGEKDGLRVRTVEFDSEASEPPHPALSPAGRGRSRPSPGRHFFVDMRLYVGYAIIRALYSSGRKDCRTKVRFNC